MALATLLTGCTKEETTVIHNVPAYVYTEYPEVAATAWHWNTGLTQLEYVYYNEYIDEFMINNSFVLVYLVENDVDVPLPAILYSADGQHEARVRYDVSQGMVRFIVESIDGDNTALTTMLNDMVFKVCMMVTP